MQYILAFTLFTFFAVSAFGQDGAPGIANLDSTVGNLKTGVSAPRDLETEVSVLQERLRTMEDQQRALVELVNRLQLRLEGTTVAEEPIPVAAVSPPADAEPFLPVEPVPQEVPLPETKIGSFMDRLGESYKDGFVIVETKDSAKFPFSLKLGDTTQFRYLNTTSANETFVDHLGNVRPVNHRNDFSINRSMFSFSGIAFDRRLRYSLVMWTSNTLAAVVAGGYINWDFNKAISAYAGYWNVPGSRSMTGTFPFFTSADRSMADNFFRTGFTQGIWFRGEPVKGLNYHFFVGNGLNTLTIPTAKIDTNLLLSGSAWWEPLGQYGPDGKARNMYDDYFEHDKPVIRLGASYTHSREDRFTNLDQSNPENTSLHNSDGVLTFTTGAFAPGVTVQEATYRMGAIDGGIKWRGWALNGQYYFRKLNDFTADGPMPLTSTFDHGGELSLGYFVVPKKLELYAHTSAVFGEFNNSYEWAPGVKWHFVPDHRVWLSGEVLRIKRSPYGSIIYPYTGGMTAWAPTAQLIFGF